MNQFLWGMLASLSAVAALYFSKFWRATRDPLFAGFALGFLVLAAHWAWLGLLNPTRETGHHLYLARLFAFAVIIAAVINKNRSGPHAGTGRFRRTDQQRPFDPTRTS
jgi:hypothetical protein